SPDGSEHKMGRAAGERPPGEIVLLDQNLATLRERPATDRIDPRVTESLDRAVPALLSRQTAEGWWVGEDEANCTLDSEYIFFMHYTGLVSRPKYHEKIQRFANRIRGQQRADGTWAI